MSAALKARTHEEAGAARLREAALAGYDALKAAVADMARTVTELRAAPADIVLMMASVNHVSLAAKALTEAAERLHEGADEALLAAMKESGCTGFASGSGGTVSTRVNAPTVEILGEVPEQFLVPRDPAPDRTQIRHYLAAHPQTNWARLHPGSISIVRRST
jgi:hypothetical protein